MAEGSQAVQGSDDIRTTVAAGAEKLRQSLPGRLFGGDRVLWIIIAILAVFSILVVYSSTASMAYCKAGGDTAYYALNQLKFLIGGLIVIFVVHRINYQWYEKYTRLLFIVALGLMAMTFFFGVNLNEASRWLKIPGTSYTFQPSDLLKITLVMVMAKELAKRQSSIARTPILPLRLLNFRPLTEKQRRINRDIMRETTLPLLLPVILSCGAIFFSNFSTSAMTFVTCLIMLYIGRVKIKELWRFVRIVIVVLVAAVIVMATFDVGRSRVWVNRVMDFAGVEQAEGRPRDDLQVEQAKIAIASGGIIGKGPGLSTQRANLPHSYSDFAYAFIVEEYGLLIASIICFMYVWLFARTIIIFRKCGRAFPSLLVLGLGFLITMQAMINMMVSVSLFPVTGQTLPIISLGGSSLIFTSLALGMILGVSRQTEEKTLDEPSK